MKLIVLALFAFSSLYCQAQSSGWYASVGATTNSNSPIMTVGIGHRSQWNYIGYEVGLSADNRVTKLSSYLSALNLETNVLLYPFPSNMRSNPYVGIGGQEMIYKDRSKVKVADLIRFKPSKENRGLKGIVGLQFPISRSFLEFCYLEQSNLVSHNKFELRYGKTF